MRILVIVPALIGAAVAGCGGTKSGSGSNMPASGTSTSSTTTNKSSGGGGWR